MSKIVYLFGAGASSECVPMVKDMKSRMQLFSTFLKSHASFANFKHDFTDKFTSYLDGIISQMGGVTTIDTYAKMLYRQNKRKELLRLKALLSSFLLFEQIIKPAEIILYNGQFDHSMKPSIPLKHDTETDELLRRSVDRRYLDFLINIMSENNQLFNNVSILSWNYDLQFELAYEKITGLSIEMAQQNMNIFPSPSNKYDGANPGIVKLNGTAGLIKTYGTNSLQNLLYPNSSDFNGSLRLIIDHVKINFDLAYAEPQFFFAWENEGHARQARTFARQTAREAEILIVIGYSFPNYNVDIDKDIFGQMPQLKHVFYQVPNASVSIQKQRITAINPSIWEKLEQEKDVNEFIIPRSYL